jgi:endonuclease/exonuclease/phosphatase (EEP) superfamily protein YafD
MGSSKRRQHSWTGHEFCAAAWITQHLAANSEFVAPGGDWSILEDLEDTKLRVISWNLLRRTGAAAVDVAALVERERPDLLVMQEATEELVKLPELIGGHFYWVPLPGRIHGLAAWSPHPLPTPQTLSLPISRMPGRLPPRVAQILRFGNITIANVHLSHGQLLNRWQLLRIIRTLDGPAAVIGDYNAIGPTVFPGFKDVGPRKATLVAQNVLRFRLDRCLVRGLNRVDARALERGPSDHCPIAIELAAVEQKARQSSMLTAMTGASHEQALVLGERR